MFMEQNSLKRSAFSGFIWKFAERVGAQTVSLVVSIVLARILVPDDYSVVSIVTIFFAFCNVFITGGLSTALIQKKEADEDDISDGAQGKITLYTRGAIITPTCPTLCSSVTQFENLFGKLLLKANR